MLAQTLVTSLFVLALTTAAAASSLRFKNGTYKIVQLTDIHMGDDPQKDRQTQQVRFECPTLARSCQPVFIHHCKRSACDSAQVIATVLNSEDAVDLIVLSGDMVSGYAWNGTDGWYSSKWVASIRCQCIQNAAMLHKLDLDRARHSVSQQLLRHAQASVSFAAVCRLMYLEARSPLAPDKPSSLLRVCRAFVQVQDDHRRAGQLQYTPCLHPWQS